MRLLCRLGFHQTFRDSVGRNLGTEEKPFWVIDTYRSCNYCPWTTRTIRD